MSRSRSDDVTAGRPGRRSGRCCAATEAAHDLDLVMTRRAGELIVIDADGRRVWGRGDAAFTDGVDGLDTQAVSDEDRFIGVQPLDQVAGRRPCTLPTRRRRRPGARAGVRRPGRGAARR